MSSGLAGARAVLPLCLPIAVLGVSFGLLASSAGLTAAAAAAMSLTTFAGSAQFAAVSLLGAGSSLAAAVAAAALLNARYLAMGVALAPAVRGPLWRRAVVAQLAVDESWAVAYEGEGRFDEGRLIGAALLLLAVHVSCTAIGAAAAGALVVDPRAFGLDAAFPALFVVLLRPHLRTREGLAAAVLGAGIALALTPLAPPGIAVIAAAAGALPGVGRR